MESVLKPADLKKTAWHFQKQNPRQKFGKGQLQLPENKEGAYNTANLSHEGMPY